MGRLGPVQQKILLIILGGILLGAAGNPRRYFRIFRALQNAWREIDSSSLSRGARSLHKKGFLATTPQKDGKFYFELTVKGRASAQKINLETLVIAKPKAWDKKWRIVMFDVPEGKKKVREALRYHIKRLGYVEFHKSVFIHPFPSGKEMRRIADFYNARPYVHFVVAEQIDREGELKKKFGL